MLVRELSFAGFRNLHPGQWRPCAGVNILTGENGQGKTNVLEACWLFTGGRSFRGAKDREMVQTGQEKARLALQFCGGGREQEATIALEQRRQVTLNGVKLPSAAKLAGNLCGVVFSPAHLSLIKDGPEERRRFVDSAYCQLRPGYVAALTGFQKILTQRNALLKSWRETPPDRAGEELLELWNDPLATASARLTAARCRYIRRLQPIAEEIYHGLSGGREQLSLRWESGILSPGEEPVEDAAELARRWSEAFGRHRRADMGAGFTTAGPHREDLLLTLDGMPVRQYGSQGQQRSTVLALKLAEATLLQQVTEEPPVAFLDDVMSELDISRQDYILNHIDKWQVFITCCEPTAALRMTAGKVFQVKQGVIFE